jgi:hypothetical protein
MMKSESQLLVQAINNLKPTSEFVLTNDDYSTIEWHVLEGTAPTKAAVDAEIEKIKSAEITAAEEKAAAQASAVAKLSALGLTAEEIAALKL